MYKIEKTTYGFRITFSGFIRPEEMREWLEESKRKLIRIKKKFYAFIDMRDLEPLTPEAQNAMEEGQRIYQEKGMARSVVILNNHITSMQFERIARDTGIYQWERYIDAGVNPDWEKAGIDWLINENDPSKLV